MNVGGGGEPISLIGLPVRETEYLRWDEAYCVNLPPDRYVICGEAGHVRWMLFLYEQREQARRWLKDLMDGFECEVRG